MADYPRRWASGSRTSPVLPCGSDRRDACRESAAASCGSRRQPAGNHPGSNRPTSTAVHQPIGRQSAASNSRCRNSNPTSRSISRSYLVRCSMRCASRNISLSLKYFRRSCNSASIDACACCNFSSDVMNCLAG